MKTTTTQLKGKTMTSKPFQPSQESSWDEENVVFMPTVNQPCSTKTVDGYLGGQTLNLYTDGPVAGITTIVSNEGKLISRMHFGNFDDACRHFDAMCKELDY